MTARLRCDDRFLVRVPALPYQAATPVLSEGHDPADLARAILAESTVAEAIELASPDLIASARRLATGGSIPNGDRIRLALIRYLLRMTHRATPFGLFAGVAIGRFDHAVHVRLGSAHRAVVRPDRGWLSRVLEPVEIDLLWELRVRTADGVVIRGGYARLPGENVELRLPYAGAVRVALEIAHVPTCGSDIEQAVLKGFPGEQTASVARLLRLLLAKGFLVTELRDALVSADPVGDLANVLAAYADRPVVADLLSTLQAFESQPSMATGQIARFAAGLPAGSVNVDLAVDADVRLPSAIRAEVERAAAILCRLPSAAAAHSFRAYHRAFLERYGLDRLVPVREVLDPYTGLGPPAAEPPGPVWSGPARRDLLDRLLATVSAGEPEMVLTEVDVRRWSAPGEADLCPSAELCGQVIAKSTDALARGEFLILVGGKSGAGPAGASAGRLAPVLSGGVAWLSDLVAAAAAAEAGAVPRQVLAVPTPARLANLNAVPRVTGETVGVGMCHDTGINDLVVGADAHGLRVYSRSSGREVLPVLPHLLQSAASDPVAAFLAQVAGARPGPAPWNWGDLADSAYLPRVRLGRIVLAPATWRPDPALTGTRLAYEEWCTAFSAWRHRWRVPRLVLAGYADRRLPVDVDTELGLRLLWQECRRHPELTLVESFESADGWLNGYAAEFAFPLIRDAVRPTPHRTYRPSRPVLPGGRWITAKLYVPEAGQAEVLRVHLAQWVSRLPAGVDRWFLVRYRDPEHHIRLRLRGLSILDELHGFCEALRASGLLRSLSLDGYEPETQRYGEIDAAEAVFEADSVFTLSLLKLTTKPRPTLAAGLIDLVEGLLGAKAATRWWLEREHGGVRDATGRADRDLLPDLTGVPGRAERHAALDAYRLRMADQPLPVEALLHMHSNRYAGLRPDAQARAMALARAVVKARAAKAAHRR